MENRKVLSLSIIRRSKSRGVLGGRGGRISQYLATVNMPEAGVFLLVPVPAAGNKNIPYLFRSFVATDLDERRVGRHPSW